MMVLNYKTTYYLKMDWCADVSSFLAHLFLRFCFFLWNVNVKVAWKTSFEPLINFIKNVETGFKCWRSLAVNHVKSSLVFGPEETWHQRWTFSKSDLWKTVKLGSLFVSILKLNLNFSFLLLQKCIALHFDTQFSVQPVFFVSITC